MARKEADLGSVLFAQDFLPQHWNWTDIEKAKLGDLDEMGKIIKSRLENGGCEIAEMYCIKHDKDEHKIWNEYKMIYEVNFTSLHVHFVIKFRKGKTLGELATLIGIEPNFIERPRRGGHAYDNMLSYLTHIKYAKKYQYHVSSVHTIVGKQYKEYYAERREAWLRGRAERNVLDAKQLKNFLVNGIITGEITEMDLLENEEWKYAYILNYDNFNTLLTNTKRANAKAKKLFSDN